MLRVLFISILFLLIACSKDQPAPVAPAGKALAVQDVPDPPTYLRVEEITARSARVAWDAADGATDYDVNYKRAVGGRWTNEPHKGVRLYNTIYDLEPNTEYRWAVRAENKDGPSEWVFASNFTTLPAEIRLTYHMGMDREPSFSPDGQRIVFYSPFHNRWWDIYAMDLDGSNRTRLTTHETGEWSPRWSPDGLRIAFVSQRDGHDSIHIMDANGGNETRLTNNNRHDEYPRWSPNGMRLAYVSVHRTSKSENREIYVIDADGSNERRLTRDVEHNWLPAWSHDSKRIAFVSQRNSVVEIHVMDADGNNKKRLTQENDSWSPAWSPDGTQIAYSSLYSGRNYEIYVMDADGNNKKRLTWDEGLDRSPAWSPDTAHWHKDGSFFCHFLDSPEQALLVVLQWTDTPPKSGGTFVACDSFRHVARYLADHPEGVDPGACNFLINQCQDFIELTGQTGDLTLLHPFTLHASSPNHSGRPRFMTNPPVALKEPLNFNRENPADFSLVERGVLQALGVNRYDVPPYGPERVVRPLVSPFPTFL